MQYKDYYKIIGLSKNSTQDEIKSAYRKLAHKYHPDISKERDAEGKFKELVEAYKVLKDSQKRADYNKLISNWKVDDDINTFSNSLGRLFGWNPTQQGLHARGQDSHSKIYINLDDIVQGSTYNIHLSTPERDAQNHVQTKHKSLNIKIPKGIKPGQYIRLSGQGAPGSGGGQAGDLLLEIALNDHPLYRVSETDIYLDLPVTPLEAKLGTKIKVPTPKGVINLIIPPKSQQGSKLRLKGYGLPGEIPGNFLVILKIVLPSKNAEQAKIAYKKMQQQINDIVSKFC